MTTAPAAQTKPAGPPSLKERRDQELKEEKDREKAADEAAYKRATEGPSDEMKEKIIALGGDPTRASPAIEQNLGDPPAGITTTSGAYRSPIDPTTADVPADKDSDFVRRAPRGFAALKGKGKGGEQSHSSPPPAAPAPAQRR